MDVWKSVCAIVRSGGGSAADSELSPSSGLLRKPGVLIVGEVHDNPLHHLLQATLLRAFAATRNRPPALVMEHFHPGQSEVLDKFRKSVERNVGRAVHADAESARLGRELNWSRSGWPAWEMFQPIVRTAVELGIPVLPGNVTRSEIRTVARKGIEAVTPERRRLLQLDKPLSPPLHNALLSQLEKSHCNLMPKSAFGSMAQAQRLRDGNLAHKTLQAASTHDAAVLLAGNGHARGDRGVPWYLARMAKAPKVLTVAIVEIVPGRDKVWDYGPRSPDGALAVDVLIVTPRQPRADPCEKMRARFKRRK